VPLVPHGKDAQQIPLGQKTKEKSDQERRRREKQVCLEWRESERRKILVQGATSLSIISITRGKKKRKSSKGGKRLESKNLECS